MDQRVDCYIRSIFLFGYLTPRSTLTFKHSVGAYGIRRSFDPPSLSLFLTSVISRILPPPTATYRRRFWITESVLQTAVRTDLLRRAGDSGPCHRRNEGYKSLGISNGSQGIQGATLAPKRARGFMYYVSCTMRCNNVLISVE